MTEAHGDGGFRVDATTREVHGHLGIVTLTSKECTLLLALTRCPGTAVTRQDLMTELWGPDPAVSRGLDRRLDVHIATLRAKLAASAGTGPAATRIDTVRGTGYRFMP